LQIGKTFKNLTRLQDISFTIGFLNEDNIQISDTGLKNLLQGFKNLRSLDFIDFSFYNCPMISDATLEHFVQTLKILEYSETILLSFSECSGMTKKGLKNFKKTLKTFMLECLSIDAI